MCRGYSKPTACTLRVGQTSIVLSSRAHLHWRVAAQQISVPGITSAPGTSGSYGLAPQEGKQCIQSDKQLLDICNVVLSSTFFSQPFDLQQLRTFQISLQRISVGSAVYTSRINQRCVLSPGRVIEFLWLTHKLLWSHSLAYHPNSDSRFITTSLVVCDILRPTIRRLSIGISHEIASRRSSHELVLSGSIALCATRHCRL